MISALGYPPFAFTQGFHNHAQGGQTFYFSFSFLMYVCVRFTVPSHLFIASSWNFAQSKFDALTFQETNIHSSQTRIAQFGMTLVSTAHNFCQYLIPMAPPRLSRQNHWASHRRIASHRPCHSSSAPDNGTPHKISGSPRDPREVIVRSFR